MTRSVRAEFLCMHLTRRGGGINQGGTAHPLWSLWAGQFRRQCSVLKLVSKNEGEEPGGRSFKI